MSSVRISGTEYIPALPSHDAIRMDIDQCLVRVIPLTMAIGVFCRVCRGQWFANGNKRTATMKANHQLIHDGVGLFALPLPDLMGEDFRRVLTDYYESADESGMSAWLREHAIVTRFD